MFPFLSPIPFNNITALAKDGKGRMWIGGSEGILGYIDAASKKFTNLSIWQGTDQKKTGQQVLRFVRR